MAAATVVSLLAIVPTTTVAAAPLCGGLEPTIVFGNDDDTIVGSAGDDVIWAGDGAVDERGGNDTICGPKRAVTSSSVAWGSTDSTVDQGRTTC